MHISFPPLAEFDDRFGIPRAIVGCSILGREEFTQRLTEIHTLLAQSEQSQSWQALYSQSQRFQYLVRRCLELNGIEPDWVSFGQVEQLLLCRLDGDGNYHEGWLVELNRPPQAPAAPQKPADPLTLAETLAILSTHTQSLEEALRLADAVPANLLTEVMAARSDLQNPEEARKRKNKARNAKLREEFDSLMNVPVGEG
jgi:hypothetical protein